MIVCPRGGAVTESTHVIKTIAKASEWLRRPALESELPLTIQQWKTSNGRLRVEIYDCKGDLLTKRG